MIDTRVTYICSDGTEFSNLQAAQQWEARIVLESRASQRPLADSFSDDLMSFLGDVFNRQALRAYLETIDDETDF